MFPRLSRRLFFRTSLATTAAAAATAESLAQPAAAQEHTIAPKTTLLFQGDSITDAGRDKKQQRANVARAFGFGYPLLIASKLLADYPTAELRAYNRGISGNRVPDLAKRWDTDCIHLKPTILSVLIGVNDIWHKLNGKYDGTVADYEDGLSALLDRTLKSLPSVQLVVCEPFVLRCGAVSEDWFPEFDQRRAACKRVADSKRAIWVPFQQMFDDATTEETPPAYWAADGVHPTLAGHALMAKTWINRVF